MLDLRCEVSPCSIYGVRHGVLDFALHLLPDVHGNPLGDPDLDNYHVGHVFCLLTVGYLLFTNITYCRIVT